MSGATRFGLHAIFVSSGLLLAAGCGRGTATFLFEDAGSPVMTPHPGEDAGPDARVAHDAAGLDRGEDAEIEPPPDPGDDAGPEGEPDAAMPLPELGDGDWMPMPAGPLAATPPMGWSSANRFACAVSEQVVRAAADALVSTGLRDLGYEYVNLDDCWQTSRLSDGTIVADQNTFPAGIKALADYVHERELKFGILSSRGTGTCLGRPGSQGYEAQDANTYASFGVDYLKYASCSASLEAETQYKTMHTALAGTGRGIMLSIVDARFFEYMPAAAELWRTSSDLADNWGSMLSALDTNSRFGAYVRPSGWNDPGTLTTGNGGMTDVEYRSQFSLWAVMAAPLIVGNDLTKLSDTTKLILGNTEVIAVDQDALGYQGYRVMRQNDLEIWARPLTGAGNRAVVLLNRSGEARDVTVKWVDIGLMRGRASVRDLWAHFDRGTVEDQFTVKVPSHDVIMLKIEGQEPLPPAGNVFLSDLTVTYAANGWGPVEKDKSVGDEAAGDGKTLTIAGTTYDKGLGVHAGSLVRYRLGKKCTRFRAEVGVDDETGDKASVVFQVLVDGEPRFKTATMLRGMHSSVDVDVTGGRELKLLVTNAGDNGEYDHADWANARLDCAP